MDKTKLYQKYPLYLFLVSIALFRLPYIYLIPGATNAFLTSQSLGRVLLVLSLVFGFFILGGIKFTTKRAKTTNILLLAFLFISSLSIFYAQNTEAFITRYKDFLIGIIAFYAFYLFRNEEKKIAITLVLTMPVMIIYQLILLSSDMLSGLIQSLIYQKHFDILTYNLQRGRIYVDTYDEAFIPVIFAIFKLKNSAQTIILLLFTSALSSLAFMSNFRTRIGMLIIGWVSVVLLFKNRGKILFFLLAIFFCAVMASFISFNKFGFTFYERFLLNDNREDVITVYSRVDQINSALIMGFTSPLGVGLGNYYDNLRNNNTQSFLVTLPTGVSGREYVHNNLATVIAETGYIAFVLYLFLIVQFMLNDYKIMKERGKYKKAFVFAFWSLFFYGLFNPPIPISYQVLFWGMRGLLV